jgi:hypothetical protein
MARIGILSLKDVNSKPWRYVSGSIAAALCRDGTHEWVSKKVIRELYENVTPSSNPSRHVFNKLNVIIVPEINPPGPQTTLVLAYPTADQSSYAKRDFKALWGCNQLEWQRRIGACETP